MSPLSSNRARQRNLLGGFSGDAGERKVTSKQKNDIKEVKKLADAQIRVR